MGREVLPYGPDALGAEHAARLSAPACGCRQGWLTARASAAHACAAFSPSPLVTSFVRFTGAFAACLALVCSAAAAGEGNVVPMRLVVDGRRVDQGSIVTIAPGQTRQLQVDVMRPGGTRESVSYRRRTRYVSLTPSLVRVDRSGRVRVADPERSVRPDARENSLATIRVQYGVDPDTGEPREEYGTLYVTFRITAP